MNKLHRIIFHVDMDAFFASIEQRDDPGLKGKPVIVGADPGNGKGRGVVSAASYEARTYGVHSAMPISKAYELCPSGIFVRPDMERYCGVSERIMTLFSGYTPLVEPAGLDEAYLDMTGTERLFGGAESAAHSIKSAIREAERLTASVGIGPNKRVAKIASDFQKPDGMTFVPESGVQAFLDPLPVRRLPGVGPKTEMELVRLRIRTVADLRRTDETSLVRVFGKSGTFLRKEAEGLDDDPVVTVRDARSLSNEITFETDIKNSEILRSVLLDLSGHVGYRLRLRELQAKTVTLKIRFSDFTTMVRHRTLPAPITSSQAVYRCAAGLLSDFENDPRSVRLIGVGLTGLSIASAQTDLLMDPRHAKSLRLDDAMDRLKIKFGEQAVTLAAVRGKSDRKSGQKSGM
jgi:DNA polymerase IV